MRKYLWPSGCDRSLSLSRLAQYENETRPVAAYYGERLTQVSGDGTPGEVARRVCDALASFGIKKRR